MDYVFQRFPGFRPSLFVGNADCQNCHHIGFFRYIQYTFDLILIKGPKPARSETLCGSSKLPKAPAVSNIKAAASTS